MTGYKIAGVKSDFCVDPAEALQILDKLDGVFLSKRSIDDFGCALSAPQIGVFKSVAVFRSSDSRINWINPVVLESENIMSVTESCFEMNSSKYKNKRFQEFVIKNTIINSSGSFEERVEYYYLDNKYILTDLYSQCFYAQQMVDMFCGVCPVGWLIKNLGGNSLCYCGSGKKYKKCCK